MIRGQIFRGEQSLERLPRHFGFGPAQQPLGARAPGLHAAVRVQDDESRVDRAVKDPDQGLLAKFHAAPNPA